MNKQKIRKRPKSDSERKRKADDKLRTLRREKDKKRAICKGYVGMFECDAYTRIEFLAAFSVIVGGITLCDATCCHQTKRERSMTSLTRI